MIAPSELSDPAVRAFVGAVNAGDRAAFQEVLTPHVTMSDDGSDRDVTQWAEKEIFSSGGHMVVRTESDRGLFLIVDYRNDTWGEMRTVWRFTVEGGKISRFETGQA
ncbi:nuclear transport factor 2 family protein [Streptomyces sp. NBC_00344]|uniref:nuclear transport factor 2 family protein n=1 Tax=Streptomyces sp. NBC_00344 TaxID=2975720 RepID=UPI002E24D58D